MKNILLTGKGSYIGGSVENWLMKQPGMYRITAIDMQSDEWKEHDFSQYDVVFHVAGIAHADVGKVSEETKQLYYSVNTGLALSAAEKAKQSGVKQFIFMSSMIVYSGCGEKFITAETKPKALNFYGDSKLQADLRLQEMSDENFRVVVIRSPMIYGKGSKGNYPELAKLASKLPVFPKVKNRRSMLHIDNLCQFIKLMIDNCESGVFFPQNAEYTATSDMVGMIAKEREHKLLLVPGFGWAVRLTAKLPGKAGRLADKAFGDSAYDMSMSEYKEDYRVRSLEESIKLTEGRTKKRILVLSQYFHPEPFRINDICLEWVKNGYEVTAVTGIPNYPQGKFYDGYGFAKKRSETWNGIKIIRLPLTARGHSSAGLALNYLSFVISGFFWKCFTKVRADYVFMFEVSPMTQCLVGVWYAKRRKIPCYLYVQDLWPDNVETVTGIHSKAILGPIGKMVNYIYRNCAHIFASSPGFVEEIRKRCAEGDKDKVSYWPQYAEEFYVPAEREKAFGLTPEIPDDGSFKVIFTGNIGQAQGLEILPEAAALLKGKNVKFVIVGDGRNRDGLMRMINESAVQDMFLFIGRQPAERIPAMLGCCDAAFVSFMDNALFAKTIPAKLQSYMACGIPVIASASGETERIVKEAECGMCSPIGDAEKLAETITAMKEQSAEERLRAGLNAAAYAKKYFCKEKLMRETDRYFM